MVFVLLLLVNNPSKYETLLEELDTAFPSRDSPITGEATQNLPYFNAVIDESMRVMPLIAGGKFDIPPISRGMMVSMESS
jgi:cytochrome P450